MHPLAIRLALVALVLTACGDPAAAPDTAPVFRFSAIPDEQLTEQRARFDPVARYLADALGVAVEYVPVNHYAASVQAFKTGDVQAAWFGGLSGVQARLAVPGARAVAQGVEDPNFRSYFIAHRDAGIAPSESFPAELQGMRFTFGSEGSTSGRLMPEHFIRESTGKAPREFFGTVGFSGNHPATLAAVQSGAFQVGALNYKVYDQAEPAARDQTEIVWTTPPYADYNFTVNGDLDADFGDGFLQRLTDAFLAMPPELCQRSFRREGMIPAANADFEPIESIARSLDLAR